MRKVVIFSIITLLLLFQIIYYPGNHSPEDVLITPNKDRILCQNWSRDKNHNKIDDLIDDLINNDKSEARIPIYISYEYKPTDIDFKELSRFDFKITYIAKYINTICISNARTVDINDIANLEGVVMISMQSIFKPMLDIASPTVKARGSSEYSPETAWELGYTGMGINIAVMDSGVDDEHESLDGKFVAGVEIRDPVEIESNPDDTNGHGTAVAGIAIGNGGQNGDYKGTAPDAKLIDIKVGGKTGTYNGGNVIKAIEWCIEHKDEYNIRIISLSGGGGGSDDGNHPESLAVNEAVENGIIVVVIVGNDGPNNDGLPPPASADKAIVVGAIDDQETVTRNDDIIADFSSRGPREDDGDNESFDELKPDVVAPGVNIKTAFAATTTGTKATNGYIDYTGTSMSTPIVSGIVALMLEANEDLTPRDVKQILHETAEARGDPSFPDIDPKYNTAYGYGIVDAYKAVRMAEIYQEPNNGNGEISWPDPVELNQPTSITKHSMVLSFSECTDNNFNKYEFHKSATPNFVPSSVTEVAFSFEKSATTYEVHDLEENTTYYFKIRVINDYGLYADSNEVNGTTLSTQIGNDDYLEVDIGPTIIVTIAVVIIFSTILILFLRKRQRRTQ